ncbi:hypothetical protein BDF19DRAFT_468694 [Syncephalis fuscata]|nr:hypothetical protein BDF19DRAFT_468694 [Syncephalis fuscata]
MSQPQSDRPPVDEVATSDVDASSRPTTPTMEVVECSDPPATTNAILNEDGHSSDDEKNVANTEHHSTSSTTTTTTTATTTTTTMVVVEEIESEATVALTVDEPSIATTIGSFHEQNMISNTLSDAESIYEDLTDVVLDNEELSKASLILEETDYVDMPNNTSDPDEIVDSITQTIEVDTIDEAAESITTLKSIEPEVLDQDERNGASSLSIAIESTVLQEIEGQSTSATINTLNDATETVTSFKEETVTTSSTSSVPVPLSPTVATSTMFLDKALKIIAASREAKRSKELVDATQKAIDLLAMEDSTRQLINNIYMVFTPLQLACQTGNIPLTIASIDCIEKLISYKLIGSDAQDRRRQRQTEQLRSRNHSVTTTSVTDMTVNTPSLDEGVSVEETVVTESTTDTNQETKTPETTAGSDTATTIPIEEEKLKATIIDDIVMVVCDAFIGENTDDKVTLQIIKALLAAVSQSERPVHQSTLLRAVRTTYNIFLLSSNSANQTIAQGTLTQMVNIIFTRVRLDPKLRRSVEEGELATPTITADEEDNAPKHITGHDSEDTTNSVGLNGQEGDEHAPTTSTTEQDEQKIVESTLNDTTSVENEASNQNQHHSTQPTTDSVASSLSSTDVEIRDAYLVFRALCKLSMKPVPNDSATDLRSLSMRSKLLALHLVLDVLAAHQLVFLAPVAVVTTHANNPSSTTTTTTTFITTIKQHLCLTLSRNLVSVIPAVFECALELFWQVLCNFRMFLKKEIEVFFTEIFLPILEMKNSPFQQRLALLSVLTRICDSPQMLVELYLNYDCDREALGNIYERLVNVLSKTTTSRTLAHESSNITLQNAPAAAVISAAMPLTSASVQGHLATTAAAMGSAGNIATAEVSIRYKALESLVSILRSLVNWSDKSSDGRITSNGSTGANNHTATDQSSIIDQRSINEYRSSRNSIDTVRTGPGDTDSIMVAEESPQPSNGPDTTSTITNDDPEHFSHRKQRKQRLEDGVRLFAWKPKKGIRTLLDSGIIPSNSPQDVAHFLLNTDGLDKTMIGEYLGEGETENIAIMHAFVDMMDFRNLSFVSALRIFLQSFRLPGEAQKIDRFMLKFAERYVMYNPGEFANADAAYVLAYSVILLNTDQHNRQIKKRMTKEEFIRNNRGINDGADISIDYLEAIFDEIRDNEIKMNDANDSTVRKATGGVEQRYDFEHLSQRQKREAYAMVSEELAVKTEAVFRSMRRNRQRKMTTIQESVTFFNASHADHVKPMFEIPWMAFLAALSSPLQDSNDVTIIRMCLEGFQLAVHIVAAFEMDLARDAFISTLAKFTHLSNLNEMKPKNAKAIKCLLEIALAEGNSLNESWKDVLYCVSRLERVQLITTGGVDEDKVPELSHRAKGDATISTPMNRRPSRSNQSAPMYDEETALEASSQEVVIMVDRIFTTSAQLSGTAIKHFVAALSQISWEEIQSSSHTDHPRIFSLQKLVEISYYNMNRIRLEWSNTWSIIGEHFIQVGSHSQQNACIFAIDSLRQLSMKFLEKEELSNFKFQREFLKPFVHIISHSTDPSIRDMVIRCLNQMIAARSNNIRSGWKTILNAFVEAAKDMDESIVTMAFNNVKIIFTKHYAAVVENGSLSDLVSCFIEFCRNGRYQKISLQSIEMFRQIMDRITDQQTPSFDSLIASGNFSRSQIHTDDRQQRIWIPILFGLFEVVMDCSDLEVRTRALDILFDALRKHGAGFSQTLWTSIFDGIALRNVINLFTFYFEILRPLLDRLFDLLCACVSQDDETIAKAGCSCLLELIERNVNHLEEETWSQNNNKRSENNSNTAPPAPPPASELTDVQRCSMYCTLQLTILQTVRDMFNGPAYAAVQVDHLFSLVDAVARCYRQAQKFNKSIQFMESHPGFVALMPQLLEQEIGCLTGCIHMLLVMYKDTSERLVLQETETERRLFPLSMDTLHRYSLLTVGVEAGPRTDAFSRVVVGILTAFSELSDDKFRRNLPTLYEQVIQLLEQAPAKEVRRTMHRFLQRVGQVYDIIS